MGAHLAQQCFLLLEPESGSCGSGIPNKQDSIYLPDAERAAPSSSRTVPNSSWAAPSSSRVAPSSSRAASRSSCNYHNSRGEAKLPLTRNLKLRQFLLVERFLRRLRNHTMTIAKRQVSSTPWLAVFGFPAPTLRSSNLFLPGTMY